LRGIGREFREHLAQAREISVACDEGFGAEAGGAQACFGARPLEGIDVEPDQASAGLHAFENGLRMPAAAERAVDRDVTRVGSQAAEHFFHHDRSMRARRRSAGRENLLDLRGVALRIQFFVLLLESARVLAPVSRAPRVHRQVLRHARFEA
jgi:hypothetical protein